MSEIITLFHNEATVFSSAAICGYLADYFAHTLIGKYYRLTVESPPSRVKRKKMEQYHGTTHPVRPPQQGSRFGRRRAGDARQHHRQIHEARKVRRIYNDHILAGFAGGTADAFTLFERFEAKLEKHQGNLLRSAVEPGQRLAHRPPVAPA